MPMPNPEADEKTSPEQMEQVIAAAEASFLKFKKCSRYDRSRLLLKIAESIQARRGEFVNLIVKEAKKPRLLSEVEVTRAVNTFTLAAEEARRFSGDLIAIDGESTAQDYSAAQSYFVPRGPVLAIAPYNFPLNLVAHKVAPALAVGASVIVKPPPQASGPAFLLKKIFDDSLKSVALMDKIPFPSLQVIQADNDVVAITFPDKRITTLSFTGSDTVGWMLKEKAPKKKVCLELGGNAAVIVHKDADIKRAASRCALGAFAYAGQVCISVQRIFAQKSIFSSFVELFVEEVKKLKTGDPDQPDTIIGPVIDSKAETKILTWVQEAQREGAKIVHGGKSLSSALPAIQGLLEPTVLLRVSEKSKLFTEEVFGPVAFVNEYDEISEAFRSVNNSRFGLQAGVFTDSSKIMDLAIDSLDVGGLIFNDSPNFRADGMPYGGVKESGEGREGLKFAMEDYCERKTIVKWLGASRE